MFNPSNSPARSTPGLSLSRFVAFARRQLSQPRRAVAWLLPPVVIGVTIIALSAPSIPKIALSSEPLYAAADGDKPTLALALSVEFPTVGAQYNPGGDLDATYSNANEYLGYYDAESCYSYNNTPTETVASGLTTADYKRFDRIGAATSRKCANAFSGNFLNWASNSAIDMLRLSLSGGDRYIDTNGLTILQRAVIPNGDPTCMWNSTNFPAKQLQKDGGGAGTYWGAVPTAMVTAAGTNDIWVANTLNRIYFGTSRGGGCNNFASYNLTAPTASTNIGPIATLSQAKPSDASVQCAGEGGTCSFTGVMEVWYGANNSWKVAPANNGVACTNGVFGDPISGTVKACFTRPYTGSWTPGGGAGLNSEGFFYARVQVCNSDSSGVLLDVRDYTFCKLYPSGKYKPGGAIQKYGDQLRLAAFGYALEQTQSGAGGRYGGVLRAPMKYVGAKTFDEFGIDNTPGTGNPNSEWDQSTGVFKSNPDGDTTYNTSGVINYLNKFGRIGPTPGKYKMYDPVGELHYEAVRYLQGLQPTPAAVSGLTADMYDGFPIYSTWTDPYGGTRTKDSNYACVKSNIVVIGDINTWDGNRLPTPDAANNVPDISYWRGVVQNFERNNVTNYADGNTPSVTRQTGNPNGANGGVPGSGDRSQIMGSAYWAHTHDIRGTGWTGDSAKQRPGMRVKTFVFDVNEYGEQNDVNRRRFQNQFFMAAKYGGFEADASNSGGNPYNTWGNPFKKEDGTNSNDVWQKPTDPGEASAYYLQSSARGVLSAFDDIFSRASSDARSIAGAAITSKNLSLTVGNVIYQGAFDTATWTGDVLAIPVTLATGNNVTIGAKNWSAQEELDARPNPVTSRNIVVGIPGTSSNPKAMPFLWANVSGTDLATALDKPDSASPADGLAQDRLKYIRGDRTKESSLFRFRKHLFGDIINSGVVYSGKPAANLNAPGYAAFVTTNATRTPAVFVGANDGMLHALNATDGTELFGYIPSWVGPNLSLLTSKTYAAHHKSFVDGPPTVADANIGTDASPDWRSILVSGTGGGGKGVFALDVTDPSSFDASKVMWEFTPEDDNPATGSKYDMGFVIGKPEILKFRTSAPGATPVYKWFAVVASGVNNYETVGSINSTTGSPTLFLLDLSKPAGAAWSLNSNYYKVAIPFDATLAASKPTGIVNFKAELGSADEVTRIYLGDLHGRLWRLDFGLNSASNWSMDKLTGYSTTYDTSGVTPVPNGTPLPLFIATDSTNAPQPITMAPVVVFGGNSTTNYIGFGTGKYLEVTDKTNTQVQSFYALYDDTTNSIAARTKDTSAASSAIISARGRLKAGSVNSATQVVSVGAFKWGRRTDTDVTNSSNKFSGWYFDFPVTGEREVSNAQINGNLVVFGTLYPSTTSASTCGSPGGGGNEYTLNIDSGNGNYRPSTVGVLGELLVVQLGDAAYTNRDGSSTLSPSDSTGRRIKTITTKTIQTGSTDVKATSVTTQSIIAGRLSWRRINNYQDLKNSTP